MTRRNSNYLAQIARNAALQTTVTSEMIDLVRSRIILDSREGSQFDRWRSRVEPAVERLLQTPSIYDFILSPIAKRTQEAARER